MSEQELSYKQLPYKGPSYLFKDKDPRRSKPVRDNESHVQVFCSDNEEDRKSLADVYTKARRGHAYLEDIDKKCIEKEGKCVWYTYMVWTDKFYTNPKK